MSKDHDRLGFLVLALFAALGLVLEVLHGLRVTSYLSDSHATRRLLFTLAHAHGVLLGLVNVAYAAVMRAYALSDVRASMLLKVATALVPGGFLLGGAVLMREDPNPLVLLSGVGGICLVLGCARVWRALR
jgi:hypothetical protein